MTISIRIDLSATVKGAALFGDLNIEFVEATEKLLDVQGYSIYKFGRGFECYLIKNHNGANPLDPLAYVEDRLEMTQGWIQNAKWAELFRLDRLIIDINDSRFQYKTKRVGPGVFEWVPD